MNILRFSLRALSSKIINRCETHIKSTKLQSSHSVPLVQTLLTQTNSSFAGQDVKSENHAKGVTENIVKKVNNLIASNEHGRLFAVVQVCGKQFKITNNDIIVVEGYWPPQPGDQIRLEKVLLLGSDKFTLIGRPLLSLDQVFVNATIIEKTLSHTRTRFIKIPKKQYMRINFEKKEVTHIRITAIDVVANVNNLSSTEGLQNKIF